MGSMLAKKILGFSLLAIAAAFLAGSIDAADRERSLRLFGSPPPVDKAELFAVGLISQAGFELHSSPSFTPDATEAFFTRKDEARLVDGRPINVILWIRKQKGTWLDPQVAPFSGRYDDRDPRVSLDGRRLYFSSTRPTRSAGAPRTDHDIWFVERSESGWGEPQHLDGPVNSPAKEGSVSIAPDGSMYFTRRLPKDAGWGEIFRAPWNDEQFGEPQPMVQLNTPGYEAFPILTPAGDALIFYARDRAPGPGQYVSFIENDGTWSEPVPLGDRINTPGVAFSASFSPDGGRLLFLRRGNAPEVIEGIYSIDAAFLQTLR